jgi:polysaccharide biosynthesis transport protein
MADVPHLNELTEQSSEIDLLEYGMVVWKRKWLVTAVALAALAAATYKTYSTIPRFTARGILMIQQQEPNILTFDQVLTLDNYSSNFYPTQYNLLGSKALADKAAKRLNSEGKARAEDREKLGSESDSLRIRSLAGSIRGGTRVQPIKDTRLVEVSFSNPDPKFAADAVNAIFDSFIEMNIETRYGAAEQATEFLTKQINTLRSEIEGMETKLQAYGAEKNIVSLGNKETATEANLSEMNRALTEAQIDTARKLANYNAIRNASPDYFPETLTNPLIQKLREDYLGLNREYSRKLETFTPELPEMQRLKKDVERAKKALETETQNLIRRAESDYKAALKNEKSLEEVFNRQKNAAVQLSSGEILYNSLMTQIDNKKNVLDALMKRQSETGVSAQLKELGTSNVTVVERAEVPLSPSSPNRKKDMLKGLLFGLIGGVGLAFFLNFLDNSVKTAADVEKYAKLPSLGFVPAISQDRSGNSAGRKIFKKNPAVSVVESRNSKKIPKDASIEMITHLFPRSGISESYRLIRTSVLLSLASEKSRVLVFSSPLPGEGKTATTCNLAVTLTQAGKKVVVVDADMRKPRQHKIFNIKNTNGLTNYLTSAVKVESVIKETSIPGLFLVNSGPLPPIPSEILGSEKIAGFLEHLRKTFDYILIDTPPILAVTDALVLAPLADGLILVVWEGKTPRAALKKAKERLDLMQIKSLGVIINRTDQRNQDYYYSKYYHYYEDERSG